MARKPYVRPIAAEEVGMSERQLRYLATGEPEGPFDFLLFDTKEQFPVYLANRDLIEEEAQAHGLEESFYLYDLRKACEAHRSYNGGRPGPYGEMLERLGEPLPEYRRPESR